MNKTIKVTTTLLDEVDKDYSLRIVAEGRHVDIYTWGYSHRPGNCTGVVFYDLTISELLQLGQSIMAEAGRLIVEREEK